MRFSPQNRGKVSSAFAVGLLTVSSLLLAGSSARAGWVCDQSTIDDVSYTNGMGTWSAPTPVCFKGYNVFGTTGILEVTTQGSAGTTSYTSIFQAHAFIKVIAGFTWSGGGSPTAIPISTYQEWSFNTSGSGSPWAHVSFNGADAVGSTGDTGWISQGSYPLYAGYYGRIHSIGSDASGYATGSWVGAYSHGVSQVSAD